MTIEASPDSKTVIGVVGGAASGKDTVASLLTDRGYVHVSSSDLVREEIARRGLITSRRLQTEVANELREENGVGYWVDLSLDRVDDEVRKVVISGLYSPGEGKHLMTAYAGHLIGVIAGEGDDSELRYNRLAARSSGARDKLNYTEFLEAHNRENGGTEDHQTNLSTLLSMARFMVYNTSDLQNLEKQTVRIINSIEGN